MYTCIYVNIYIYVYTYMALSHLLPCPKLAFLPHSPNHLPKVSHSRHVCCVTQQSSAAGNSRHAFCVTQCAGLLCHKAVRSVT